MASPSHRTRRKTRTTQALPFEVRLRLQCCSHVGTPIRAPPRQLRKQAACWNPVTRTTQPWELEKELEVRTRDPQDTATLLPHCPSTGFAWMLSVTWEFTLITRPEVLTMVQMQMLVLRVAKQCGTVGKYQRFGRIYYLKHEHRNVGIYLQVHTKLQSRRHYVLSQWLDSEHTDVLSATFVIWKVTERQRWNNLNARIC